MLRYIKMNYRHLSPNEYLAYKMLAVGSFVLQVLLVTAFLIGAVVWITWLGQERKKKRAAEHRTDSDA